MPLALNDAFKAIPMDRKASSFSLQPPQLASFFQQRKARTTVIGLVFVVFLTTYVFIIHGTSFSPVLALRQSDSPTTSQLEVALESVQNARVAGSPSEQGAPAAEVAKPPPAPPSAHRHGVNAFHKSRPGHHRQRPAIKLTPEQELAAITAFIGSLSHNRIPHTVDPLEPIDPELVLDFDTHSVRASEEVRRLVEEVWALNPVFVYSRRWSAAAREVKSILDELYLKPKPTIIELDQREDGPIITAMLKRLTGAVELPLVLVGGKPLGTVEEIKSMATSGQLKQLVSEAGSVVDGAKKKGKRK